jgi:hypothetical protein
MQHEGEQSKPFNTLDERRREGRYMLETSPHIAILKILIAKTSILMNKRVGVCIP